MPIEHPVRAVTEELRRRFQLAGKGSVSRIQEQLGLGKRYFLNQRRKTRQRYDVKVLFDALEALEIDAAEFFASVVGPPDPVAAFRHRAATMLRGCKRLPRILVLERERSSDAGGDPVVADFDELDAGRYEEPKKVKRRATAIVSGLDAPEVPRLLGCYASACRVENQLDEAQIVLGRAMELADELNDEDLMADLIQRASAIAADRADLEEALALIEKATLGYSRLGDLVGVGKTLIHQGVYLSCLRQYEPALRCYKTASEMLAHEESAEMDRYRVSSFLNRAVLYRMKGELDEAERLAYRARENAGNVGRALLGNIQVFQASLAKARGQYDQAARFLRESIKTHGDAAPRDVTYSVVELCRLQLEQGRPIEACKTAKLLLPMMERLEKNRWISSYITELLRCAVAGSGMTTALVDRVAQGLKKEQTELRQHVRRA